MSLGRPNAGRLLSAGVQLRDGETALQPWRALIRASLIEKDCMSWLREIGKKLPLGRAVRRKPTFWDNVREARHGSERDARLGDV